MTLPYYDYSNYPARNPAPSSACSQAAAPPPYQSPFDYSKYNGPVCFPGGQTFNLSQSQPQQPPVHGPGAPTTYTYAPGTAIPGARPAFLQPTQGQQQPGPAQVGQLVHLAGDSQPYVVVPGGGDGYFFIAPKQ